MRRFIGLACMPVFTLVAMTAAWPAGGGSLSQPDTVLAVGEMCTPSRPSAAGTTVKNLTTPDGSRTYRLHVPTGYTGADPLPVVIAMHGAGSNSLEQEVYSGLSTKADAEGFIVAYPQGLVTGIAFTHFNAWQLPIPPEPDDVAYVKAILDTTAAQLCVDQSRVYSTGMSNGAMMSVRLACSLSSRFAAIAPVAGGYFPSIGNINPTENCLYTAVVPYIGFHGTNDTSVPYYGGVGGNGANYRLPQDDNTPAEDVIGDWAAHNGCAGARTETQIDTEVRLTEYASCGGGSIVQLYTVDGGGHTWPGSFDVPSLGYVTQQIDATDLIWAFFEQYTVPDADGDLVPDTLDSCPVDADFSQTNTDRNYIDNSPPYAPATDDRTLANSDIAGDACDPDNDNDGLTDAEEASGAGCAANVTNPLSSDSDGDRVHDGAECALGFDPALAESAPTLAQCGPIGDADADKIADRIEICYYNSATNNTDTDGDKAIDGARDGCEIASLNGDRVVSSGDQGMLAGGITGAFAYHANIDINKDGLLNSGDQGLMASFISPPGQCPV